MSTATRAIPADVGAERSLLGALLLDDSKLSDATDVLTPGDFFGDGHELIFQAIVELARRGEPIDLTTVSSELDHDPDLAAHVSSLIDGLPRSTNVQRYANLVKVKAQWRQMAKHGQELLDRALSADGNAAALARTFAVDLAAIAGDCGSSADLDFETLGEGHYRLVADAATTLEVDSIRRESHHLKGELLVRRDLPGIRSLNGVLSVGDFNFSSTRARQIHAKHLAERGGAGVDWGELLETFAQHVLTAERQGQPDVGLHEIDAPGPVEILDIDGLLLPRHHPTVLFGDGDSAKSYLALWVLARLGGKGLRVGLADWELTEADHRDRLGRLFAGDMPPIRYLRCARPIVHEAERLRRWVRDQRLDYIACDSVAYASAGAPESADVAMAYFQSLRQLGDVGSLNIAHITKAADGADRRPFGSTFWHNSPRATWFARVADRDAGNTVTTVGLFPRKFNVGPLPSAVGFELAFSPTRTRVRRVDVADVQDLAAKLPVSERMRQLLRHGPLTVAEIAERIDTTANTVKGTVRRKPNLFHRVANGEGANAIALVERRPES